MHKSARLTGKGRAGLIEKIHQVGLRAGSRAMAVYTNIARKWLHRFQAQGPAGLLDRSLRPARHRSNPATKIECSIALHRNHVLGYASIGERAGLPTSSVARHCAKAGVQRAASPKKRCRAMRKSG